MSTGIDFFVILADMRTGSNLLEERLACFPGLICHGEIFNPAFIGHEGQTTLFGQSIDDRDRDPLRMIARMLAHSDGTPGFRLFPGHDPRILDHCLANPRCAKVVLARNPVDSYVSRKIAQTTGQWWLGDGRTARSTRVRFEADEFEAFLDRLGEFYGHVRRRLQTSAQTAFHIHYDDLADSAVVDGLARWLGATGDPQGTPKALAQNPEALDVKVENFEEMERALRSVDPFGLYRVPDLEPRRGPNVPSWLASDALGLLYMPIAGGPTTRVVTWMAAAGGAQPARGLTRKSLRAWMRATPGHRSFTVVTHPLRRAHDAFEDRVLGTGPDSFGDIRSLLRNRYGLDLPAPGERLERARHRAAFLGFLRFLRANLSAQTSVRVPAAWASQVVLVRAMSETLPPDVIVRAETLERDLSLLRPGHHPALPDPATALADIYDPEIEAAARDACERDYITFGYGPWR
jgi:LPS sulfotransferase NodH